MTTEKKKILLRVGLAAAIMFAFGLIFLSLMFSCISSGEISAYSPRRCFCLSSNIRNFPLVGLQGAPKYFQNQNFGEPNYQNPPYMTLEFLSDKSPEEIAAEVRKYMQGIGYIEIAENVAARSFDNRETRLEFKGKDTFLFDSSDSQFTRIMISIDRRKNSSEAENSASSDFNSVKVQETFSEEDNS